MIEDSLRCFAYGWCSFIPFLGLPLLVLTIRAYQQARIRTAGEWNPAARYLNWGMILASIGGFLSAIWFGMVFFAILNMS